MTDSSTRAYLEPAVSCYVMVWKWNVDATGSAANPWTTSDRKCWNEGWCIAGRAAAAAAAAVVKIDG